MVEDAGGRLLFRCDRTTNGDGLFSAILCRRDAGNRGDKSEYGRPAKEEVFQKPLLYFTWSLQCCNCMAADETEPIEPSESCSVAAEPSCM